MPDFYEQITQEEIDAAHVQRAPDTLTGTAQQNKKVFDRLTEEVIVPKFNGLVQKMNGPGGALPELFFVTPNQTAIADIVAAVRGDKLCLIREEGTADGTETVKIYLLNGWSAGTAPENLASCLFVQAATGTPGEVSTAWAARETASGETWEQLTMPKSQSELVGEPGQVIGFGADNRAVAQAPNVMIVKPVDQSQVSQLNATSGEILEAHNAGRTVIALVGEAQYNLVIPHADLATFYAVSGGENAVRFYQLTVDQTGHGEYAYGDHNTSPHAHSDIRAMVNDKAKRVVIPFAEIGVAMPAPGGENTWRMTRSAYELLAGAAEAHKTGASVVMTRTDSEASMDGPVEEQWHLAYSDGYETFEGYAYNLTLNGDEGSWLRITALQGMGSDAYDGKIHLGRRDGKHNGVVVGYDTLGVSLPEVGASAENPALGEAPFRELTSAAQAVKDGKTAGIAVPNKAGGPVWVATNAEIKVGFATIGHVSGPEITVKLTLAGPGSDYLTLLAKEHLRPDESYTYSVKVRREDSGGSVDHVVEFSTTEPTDRRRIWANPEDDTPTGSGLIDDAAPSPGKVFSSAKTSALLAEKADTTAIDTLPASSIELAHNTVYRAGVVSTIAFTLPTDLMMTSVFEAEIDITAGPTPIQVNSPASLIWLGDDVENGAWAPKAGKRYAIYVFWDGEKYRAIAQAVKVAG